MFYWKEGKRWKSFDFSCLGSIPSCCGIEDVGEFYAQTWSTEKKAVGDDWIDREKITKRALFKELVKECLRRGSIIMADRKGGDADRVLFPLAPKRAFFLTDAGVKWKCKAHLSDYYHNSNSGARIRHCIVTMEKA